jgi:undecaprenyl pyrophosphate phosphatase UppP
MNDNLKQIASIQNKAGTIRVQNILSPLLWLCAICIPTGMLGLIFADNIIKTTLFSFLLLLPLFSAVGGYIYFALTDPRRLHSEEYLIKSEQIQLMSKKEGVITNPEDLNTVDLDAPMSFGGELDHD